MRHSLVCALLLAALAGLWAGCTPGASPGPLLEYSRSGGIAGFDDHLVVESSGKAVLTRRTARSEFTVDPAMLSQLQATAEQADFAKLRGEHLPARPGADLFEYVLIYKGNRVRTMDTAVPESLQPLLQLLNQVVESGGKPK